MNFSLMYFLAPTAGTTAAGANLLQKLFSEQTLLAWGAPGTVVQGPEVIASTLIGSCLSLLHSGCRCVNGR